MLAYGKSHKKLIPKPAKLPDSITTIEDLFASDNVNEILADTNKEKPDIKDLIVIYIDRNNELHYRITKTTMITDAVWALEYTKKDQMENEDEDE